MVRAHFWPLRHAVFDSEAPFPSPSTAMRELGLPAPMVQRRDKGVELGRRDHANDDGRSTQRAHGLLHPRTLDEHSARDRDGVVQSEPGMPSGPGKPVDPEDMQDEELMKRLTPLFPVGDGDVLKVAFAREYGPTHMTMDFKKEFDETFGLAAYPLGISEGNEVREDYTGMELGPELFRGFRQEQDRAFDYRKLESGEQEDSRPGRGDSGVLDQDEQKFS